MRRSVLTGADCRCTRALGDAAIAMSQIIRQYARYLLVRLEQFYAAQLDWNRAPSGDVLLRLKKMLPGDLLRQIQSIQSILDALFEVQFTPQICTTDASANAIELLLEDAVPKYVVLNDALITCLGAMRAGAPSACSARRYAPANPAAGLRRVDGRHERAGVAHAVRRLSRVHRRDTRHQGVARGGLRDTGGALGAPGGARKPAAAYPRHPAADHRWLH